MTTQPVPVIPLRFDPATRTYHQILAAGERQLATTDVGQALTAAGFGDQVRDLIQRTAANAANPIVDAFEDALTPTP